MRSDLALSVLAPFDDDDYALDPLSTGALRAAPLPLDLVVPVRTDEPTDGLDSFSQYLLRFVDGDHSLLDIASALGVEALDLHAQFLVLLADGFVVLGGGTPGGAPPASNVYHR